jgi:hypothetical protein
MGRYIKMDWKKWALIWIELTEGGICCELHVHDDDDDDDEDDKQ